MHTEQSGQAFALLADRAIFEPALAGRLARVAGLRKPMVHQYVDLDRARLARAIEDGLDRFAAAIRAHARAAGR